MCDCVYMFSTIWEFAESADYVTQHKIHRTLPICRLAHTNCTNC